MTPVLLVGAVVAAAYALVTLRRERLPLFYEIVAYALGAYALGTLYTCLRASGIAGGEQTDTPIIGYLGYAGAFFFLFSSYYGAIDSLADERDRKMRPRRAAALILALALLLTGGGALVSLGRPLAATALAPVTATSYFALKHLLSPDVEMGLVNALRPYNAAVLACCLAQPLVLAGFGGITGILVSLLGAVLLVCLPALARRGVLRWFM